jgi:hypothetical protein
MNPPAKNPIFDHPMPTTPAKPPGDRLTAQLTIVHEHCCEPPIPIHPQFTRLLETTEQVWGRRQKVNCTPTPLDLGWLKDLPISYLILVNNAGLGGTANPTEEEKRIIDETVIQLRDSDGLNLWRIRPRGGFHAGEPGAPGTLVVSCPHNTEIMVYAIPG